MSEKATVGVEYPGWEDFLAITEKVLNTLLQIKGMDSLAASGMAMGMAASGASTTTAGMLGLVNPHQATQPSVPASAISQAAAAPATSAAHPVTSPSVASPVPPPQPQLQQQNSYINALAAQLGYGQVPPAQQAQPSFSGSPPVVPSQGVPSINKSWDDFMGSIAYMQALQSATSMAGGISRSVATGSNFHFERHIGDMLVAGGAGVGFAYAGPAGAGLGAGAMGIVKSFVDPLFERGAQIDDLQEIYRVQKLGGIPTHFNSDTAKEMAQAALEGRPMSTSAAESYSNGTSTNQLIAHLTGRMNRNRYGEVARLRYGTPSGRETEMESWKKVIAEQSAGFYGNEDEKVGLFNELEMPAMADYMRQQGDIRRRNEASMIRNTAAAGYAASGYDIQARYARSAGELSGAGQSVIHATGMVAGNMRTKAGQLRASQQYEEADALEFQAAQVERQTAFQVKETAFGVQKGILDADSALGVGRSTRAFDTALYGGQSARDLPYAEISKEYSKKVNGLVGYMEDRRRAGMLSKSEESLLQNEIEELKQKATIGVARERDQRIAGEIQSGAQYKVASMRSDSIAGIMRGNIEQQGVGQVDLSLKSVQAEKEAIQEILSISRTLTREEQLRYGAQVKGLDARQKELLVMRDLAVAQAAITRTDLRAAVGGAQAQGSLIYGEGGRAVVEANVTMAHLTGGQIQTRTQERQKLISAGFSPESKEVMELDSQIAQMKNQQAQYARNAAVQPFSAKDEIGLSNLQTSMQLMKTGYGSFGDIRANLGAQIDLIGNHLQEMEANKMRQSTAGKWTPGMERDFTLAQNQYKLQLGQLANEFQNGWDQRIISEAFNMPGNGRMYGAAFTHREASINGVINRAFGGTEEQTRGAREQSRSIYLGTGNPRNMSRLPGMSGDGEQETPKVEITLKIEQTPGFNLRATSTQITNQKTAQDITVNPYNQQTPGG